MHGNRNGVKAGDTTISAVSMHCCHDPEVNWRKYLEFIEEAALQGTDYIVFPEVSVHGYLFGGGRIGTPEMAEQLRYFRRVAEPVPGPLTDKLTELAGRHNMMIQAGFAERAMDGNIIYNSAVLVDGRGIIGLFRKAHNPFEWPVFRPGHELPVFQTPLGKIGMFICYDLAFPEVSRALALQGAVIASLTTAWPMQGDDPATDYGGYTYDLMSRAMAFANQMWMVCSNQVHRPPSPGCRDYYGHSRIIAPNGRIIVDTGHEEGLATATVDLYEGLEKTRTWDWDCLNLLHDRRPELYGALTSEVIYSGHDFPDRRQPSSNGNGRAGVANRGFHTTAREEQLQRQPW